MAAFSEQIGGMPDCIVVEDFLDAVEKLRERQRHTDGRRLTDGEPVNGPDNQNRDGDGEQQRDEPAPGIGKHSGQPGPGGNKIAEPRRPRGQGQESEYGDLGDYGESDTGAE